MNIAIDIDDVLRDFVGQLIRQYKSDFPKAKLNLPINAWNMAPHFPGIGDGIIDYFKNVRPKEIFEDAPAYQGAQLVCDLLKRDGHRVWLVTTQQHGNEKYTLNWIEKNDIAYDHICFTHDKGKIMCDILIDDGLHNLEAFQSRTNPGISVCMNRTWNTQFIGHRVYSLQEFYNLVTLFEKDKQ